jgi:hypothetical protein
VSDIAQRAASLEDIKDIWGLMRQSASDIPIDIESEVDQERILTEVMACCTAGMSPLAVDAKKEIIGALLAKRDEFDWGFRNAETINVSFAAVAPGHRDQGVLKMLVDEIIKRNAPVYVGVKAGDKHGLAAELEKSGFLRQAEDADGRGELYKWEPSAQS